MILISTDLENADEWISAFLAIDPNLPIVSYQAGMDLSQIEYAIIAKPHAGVLENIPNLKAIFSLWAGVESSVKVKGFPLHIPLYRMVDEGMAQAITEYIIGRIFIQHLSIHRFEAQQKQVVWDDKFYPNFATDTAVGIMGIGAIGSYALQKLSQIGFQARGWSKSPKDIDGVISFAGKEELPKFLSECDYLISLLPFTPATQNIFNGDVFSACKGGCYFINVGRGEQVVDEALISALDSGHLSGACLDVFREEPLPADSPFWRHPKITVTPHIAGITPRHSGAAHILNTMKKLSNGQVCEIGLYNPEKGY